MTFHFCPLTSQTVAIDPFVGDRARLLNAEKTVVPTNNAQPLPIFATNGGLTILQWNVGQKWRAYVDSRKATITIHRFRTSSVGSIEISLRKPLACTGPKRFHFQAPKNYLKYLNAAVSSSSIVC